MCFKNPFVFTISNYEGKTVQIDGQNLDDEKSKSNGSGKSTLLETINWGLFGELCRKNRYKDETISKKEKKAKVEINFETHQLEVLNASLITTYKVIRTIERKKTPSVNIWKSGVEMWVGATYQTKQEELEKILGMNFISFQCYVMFGRDFNNFPDLKPGERAKILTDIRGLEKYLDASRRAGESSKAVGIALVQSEKILGIKDGKLTEIRATSHKADIDSFESDRLLNIETAELLISKKEAAMNSENERVQRERSAIEENIAYIDDEIFGLLDGIPNRKEIADRNANSQSQLLGVLSQKDSNKRQSGKLNDEIIRLSKSGEGPCPYCGQTITGVYLQTRVSQLGLEAMEFGNELNELNEQEKVIRADMKADRILLDDVDTRMASIESLRADRQKSEIELATFEGSNSVKILEVQIEELNKKLTAKKNEINPYLEMETKRKNRIKELGAEIREINKEIEGLEKQKKFFDIWVDGFKKIRMMIFDTMISQLESIAQGYLSQYSSELNIIMTTERETRSGTIKDEFHISIVDANGDEISYEMYSGGERQKIRLSISRALAQFIKEGCGVDFNIVAFDEPNDSLDDVGKEVNFETFLELSEKDGKAVFVTDHDSLQKDRFDYSITIIKENGESRIVI